MSKSVSLLRFQLKVLSAYLKKTNLKPNIIKEFFVYLLYYFCNWWYYLFVTNYESLVIKNKPLKEIDKRLAELYETENQFWISLKEGYKLKSEKITNLTYGETTYFSIRKSFEFVNLTKDDVFYDLGCGIGKTVFLANVVFGATSTGVDIIPAFITNGNQVSDEFKLNKIKFIEKSLFDINFKDGTVFYITPTCFDTENMKKLYKKFESLPKGARLIVLSRDIKLPNLQPLGKKALFYSWGRAETFYYKVV